MASFCCLAAETEREAAARAATRCACTMLLGGALSQAGWWSLYGDLGLWGGVIGGALILVGALGSGVGPRR